MQGLYRLYHLRFTSDGQQSRRMVGRFLIYNGHIRILEDHHGSLHELLGSGELTTQTIERLNSMKRSGYWELIHEDDLNQGNHPEHVPDLDMGPEQPTPEATFTVSGSSLPAPQHLEVWPDVCVLDGKNLTKEEVEVLMSAIEMGKLTLTPHQ